MFSMPVVESGLLYPCTLNRLKASRLIRRLVCSVIGNTLNNDASATQLNGPGSTFWRRGATQDRDYR